MGGGRVPAVGPEGGRRRHRAGPLRPPGCRRRTGRRRQPVHETLPAAHAYRRQNRGYEGLAISPDGTSLFVALQSPLQLPPDPNVGRDSRNTRILRLDMEGRVTGEFVYRFDAAAGFDPANSARARDMKVSGLYAVSATRLLVLERTDFVAKVYLVDLTTGTDISGRPPTGAPANDLEGRNDDATLAEIGIAPLAKTLVVDLDTIDSMPDKIEGLTVVGPSVIAVANDNDFGLTDSPTWTPDGRLASDTAVASRLLYVALPEPLPLGRGYLNVAADGGVFAFGRAPFLGGLGGLALTRPVVGAA
ncbi:MAG: esterase-like activity of phytase family protein, partial [Acidimicrobiales bacterium]